VTPAPFRDAPAGLPVVQSLARAAGARAVTMDAAEHDAAVAAISHLPLVAAAALVESVASDTAGWAAARPLSASGWRDMTRLARGDLDMGAGILATNAGLIAERLRAYRDVIERWLDDLDRIAEGRAASPAGGPEQASVARVRARLAAARDVLDDGHSS
jgi:prephenate dehydrogenase